MAGFRCFEEFTNCLQDDEIIGGEALTLDSVKEIQWTIDYMEERNDILKQNLVGLRHIQFQNMEFGGLRTAFLLLGKLFQCCPDLITLKIPLRYLDNPPNIGFGNPNKLTCLPLVSYLKTIASNKYHSLSKIDFGVSDYYSRQTDNNLLSLSESTLIKLAESSEPIGVKLYNVPASALPRHEYLTDNQKYCLNKSVASIQCTKVASGIPNTVHVPPGCPIKIIVACSDDFSLFQLAESLNIVSIISISVSSPPDTANIARILFQVYRPCVTELELYGPDSVAAVGKDLASVFPNLKSLAIFRCWEPIKIWHLLDNLHHLEELRMEEVNILEYHTSGHSFAHRLGQMKNLKRVKIVYSTVDISVDFCTLATSSTFAQFLMADKTPPKHQLIVNLCAVVTVKGLAKH